MARRRKQTYDPGQLTLFDIIAGHIEIIRAENIQADLEEEKSRAAQPGETVGEKPAHDGAQPDSSPPYARLGVNGKGAIVYALKEGGRMVSRNPANMQAVDGDKDTVANLYARGKHDYLTVEEVAAFAKNDTFTLEVHHARQTDKPAGNRKKGAQARNDTGNQERGVHQFSLFNSGQVGAEQPGRIEAPGSSRSDSFRSETVRPATGGSASPDQRISPASEAPGDERLGDSGTGGSGHGTENNRVSREEAFRSEAVNRYGEFADRKIIFGYAGGDKDTIQISYVDGTDNQDTEKSDFDTDAGAVSLADTVPARADYPVENYRITPDDQLRVGAAIWGEYLAASYSTMSL